MPTVTAQKLPSRKAPSTEYILAQFCYHYPQYTFAQARKLPARRIIQMLRVVDREEAKKMLLLTQMMAAPQTKKMKAVKKLMAIFKSVIDGI